MKKTFIKTAVLLICVIVLTACDAGEVAVGGDMSKVMMTAEIKSVSDRIEVEVIDGEYEVSGIFWVIVADFTEIYGANGSEILPSDLKAGDKIQINYNGQVMMSYPPQIVAHEIKVIK